MSEPQNAKEYLERFNANYRMWGRGIGNVHQSLPCPFCAAPDFMVFELLEAEDIFKRSATCQECGRSAKALFTDLPNGKLFEIVQTGGPPPPAWLSPPMRRLES